MTFAKQIAAAVRVLPKIPSGKEIYDSIMREIEPELLSSIIPTLNEKYKNETPLEWEQRKKRYNKAFAKFHQVYDVYMEDLRIRIHRYHQESMKDFEEQSRLQEERSLNHLAASMFSLS